MVYCYYIFYGCLLVDALYKIQCMDCIYGVFILEDQVISDQKKNKDSRRFFVIKYFYSLCTDISRGEKIPNLLRVRQFYSLTTHEF